jgi:CheY-like chemotaxis protein
MGAAAIPGARPGNFLQIDVGDTGTGIPPDVIARIWEPFFTTKGEGKGTGLGLSTVRGIVTQHGGVITLQSEVGRGTTFTILLPAAPGSETGSDAGGLVAVPRGQGELILVVDDDASIREITTAMLTGHGYRVLSAADGPAAVALFAPRSLEIRAIVAELNTPHLDGVALLKIVRALNPSVRVVLVSGSAETTKALPDKTPATTFLRKPYSGETLLRTVHQLFNETPAPEAAAAQAPVEGS